MHQRRPLSAPLVDGLVRAAVAADEGGLDTVWVPSQADLDVLVGAAADVAELGTQGGTP